MILYRAVKVVWSVWYVVNYISLSVCVNTHHFSSQIVAESEVVLLEGLMLKDWRLNQRKLHMIIKIDFNGRFGLEVEIGD